MCNSLRWMILCAAAAVALWVRTAETEQPRQLVLESVRIIDGGGATESST